MRSPIAKWPLALTLTRIVLNPLLWLLAFQRETNAFVGVLLIAGATDAVDGALARRTGHTSQRGAWWDSLADGLLGLSSLGWMWLFLADFLRPHLPLIAIVVALNLLSYALGWAKYKRLVAYHLLTDKLSGPVYFGFMAHSLIFGPSLTFLYCVLALNTWSSFEEMVATLRYDRMRSDILTAFGAATQEEALTK